MTSGGFYRPGSLVIRMPRENQSPAPRRRRVSSTGRRRRAASTEPQTPPPPPARSPRYNMVRYPDDTLRPVRHATRRDGMKRQAEADMYGDVAPLSTGANMRDITSVLTEVVSRLDLQEAEFAPEFLAGVWKRAMGDFVASQSTLVSLRDGCATIRAPHPTVRFELRRQRQGLIRTLNEAMGENCVRSVNVRSK